jgi:hypothetical protein
MAANPGQVMHGAIKAVVDMQSDCIKLFEDLEKDKLAGLKSFYGNVVALDLGQAMSRRRYVAQTLARLYYRDGDESQMLGLNACFYDFTQPQFIEPVLIAARLTYSGKLIDASERSERGWDPWYAYFNWTTEKRYSEAITISRPPKRATLERVVLAASPLYDIRTLEAALTLLSLVGGL